MKNMYNIMHFVIAEIHKSSVCKMIFLSVMSPAGPGTKSDCAGKVRQQITAQDQANTAVGG